jgi:hypothetical protein
MTVILEMRRAHQHLFTYLSNSIYFERIAILIRLDGLLTLKGCLNYLIFQSFDYEGYLMTVIQEMSRVH